MVILVVNTSQLTLTIVRPVKRDWAVLSKDTPMDISIEKSVRQSVYFLPLFDRPKINIVFSNTLKVRSCIANQIYNSKTIL